MKADLRRGRQERRQKMVTEQLTRTGSTPAEKTAAAQASAGWTAEL